MKRIQMPSSYAVVPDGEKALLGGGGAFRDAWTSFTDHLRFTDFFFRGGLLSLSISFIPKLLFNVVKAGFNAVEGVHTFFFGGPSKAAEDLQTYKNDMSACVQTQSLSAADFPEIKNALRRWILTMPQGILLCFT